MIDWQGFTPRFWSKLGVSGGKKVVRFENHLFEAQQVGSGFYDARINIGLFSWVRPGF